MKDLNMNSIEILDKITYGTKDEIADIINKASSEGGKDNY
ncbi:hypothetical protein HMPREF9372_2785 [Sporosarcina newyorkensis 2681]|uniref:Uncharacterized protein n=1 Tax=Sporosarcina newyorkensis 2681 TaxID=1027292 RepID=F9DVF4_9BACL|nr:hypothetical protein HMPREF9372_2785 [Sporosarcina newyorkensis 2681]